MNILREIQSRFAAALAGVAENPADLLGLIRPSQDAKFGDYQANMAMPLGKQLGKPPREIAAEIVSRLKIDDLCTPPEIAGPGFINLKLRDDLVAKLAETATSDPRCGVPTVAKPRKFVIDFSAPNVAKPMHVGHIRSTVIGDCLCRTVKFLGHNAVSDNHLGDWGTQFGMILYGFRIQQGVESLEVIETMGEFSAGRFGQIYSQFSKESEQSPEVRAKVLAETAKLHSNDANSKRWWEIICKISLAELKKIYDRLNVTFDEQLGESFYHNQLADTVYDLIESGLARESEGALCVFLEGFDAPLIVRKKDGAYLYATTDLATIKYRIERWHPDAILYVVDHRQSLHFQQLFATARLWKPEYREVDFEHVSFGTVLGKDGKPFKTRSGDTVGLESLLDEGVSRALKIVSDNDEAKKDGPELDAAERQHIAEVVGIGALKYADLSQNRTSDYVFDYDKMLAMTGNTATYMQYAHARIRGIFNKGQQQLARSKPSPLGRGQGEGAGNSLRTSTEHPHPGPLPEGEGVQNPGARIVLLHPAERALALAGLQFAEALDSVLAEYRPNQLTNYLFELANRFSAFYENCPVLRAETPELLASRLALCGFTANVLKQGLALLGIAVVDRM